MFQSINPATGEVIATFPFQTAAEVDHMLTDAVEAQRHWARTPVVARSELLRRMATALRAKTTEIATLVTREMGKPIGEAQGEVLKCALNCDYYADNAERFLTPDIIPSNATDSYVVLDPLGVVLAIMPWNFPIWQVFRFLAPAIAAGNGVALKHAANVPLCARAIMDIIEGAGAPAGLVVNLTVQSSNIAALIADDRIAGVTLTGSTEVGMIVAAQAGKALKKQVLELGGSDPFIVLADADLAAAAKVAVRARFHNTGQSCVCAKRFIVEEAVADRFVELVIAEMATLVVGDPANSATQVGPMAKDNLRAELFALVESSLQVGAILKAGGRPLNRPGFYVEPTLLDHVTPGMAMFDQETFGPAAAVVRARDAADAIRLANATPFGLGAALWTADIGNARRLAREIEAGAVFINGQVASDPRLPFGGIKKSGYGRELSIHGLREFTNIKTVWIGPAKAA
jgi:succinate-semialdehyde dehydrogenase / glutarate-semialdehyde dehydrogenase